MASLKDIIAQNKKIYISTEEEKLDCHGEVARLKEINHHLEAKITRLYTLLEGDTSGLLDREKDCEVKLKKVADAIIKLESGKREISRLIESTNQKILELEEKEQFLLLKIKKLQSENQLLQEENQRLEKEVTEVKEMNLRLLRATSTEQVYEEVGARDVSHPQIENAEIQILEKGKAQPSHSQTTKIDIKDKRLEKMEKKVESMGTQLDNIQKLLNKFVSESVNLSPVRAEDIYGNVVDNFLKEDF
jgi:chromosome segregation ATPase